MLGNAFSGWHLVIILFIVLLLFGAPKLPGLARSLGQSMKIFKTEIKGDKGDSATDETPQAQSPQSPTTDGPVDPAAKP